MVAVPVLAPNQTFVGLVGGWLDLSSANFLVEILHNRLGTTGYYCLVSAGPDPVYIRHPDPAQARQPALAVADTCGEDDSPAPLEFITPARPVIARYLMSSTGWELVALLPAREAYAPLHQMQQRFLGMAGVAMAAVALLIWLAVRRQLAPLARCTRWCRPAPTTCPRSSGCDTAAARRDRRPDARLHQADARRARAPPGAGPQRTAPARGDRYAAVATGLYRHR